jgi:hypothetical protein
MSSDALSDQPAAGVVLAMSSGDAYRVKATELSALAKNEPYGSLKSEFENLARAYLRLAEQAEHNSQFDIVYETPPPKKRDDDPKH